jgi:hypothetical protein
MLVISLICICFSAASVCSAASPVIVTHALTGSSQEGNKTTLKFTVHVVNSGEASITGLALSLAPLPPVDPGQTTLEVAKLGAHESVDLPAHLTVSASIKPDYISSRPLFWAGKCIDSSGTPFEFPITSLPGGAR